MIKKRHLIAPNSAYSQTIYRCRRCTPILCSIREPHAHPFPEAEITDEPETDPEPEVEIVSVPEHSQRPTINPEPVIERPVNSDDSLMYLINMGFDVETASRTLSITKNLHTALDMLLQLN